MRRLLPWTVPLVALALLAGACGDDDGRDGGGAALDAVPVADRSRPGPDDDPTVAGTPMTGFGADLLCVLTDEADDGANVIVSPTSVAIALAMMEPGTVDDAGTQVRELLGIEDPAAYHAAMNALEQDLETRQVDAGDEDAGELTLRIANAAFLQAGYPFEPDYLDTVGRHYGPVLNEVDFPPDPDAVAAEINRWVADNTEDRITDLIPDGALTADTVLALVNALYLRASWTEPFEERRTEDDTFSRLDGDEVAVPLMHGASDGSAQGDGWVGATKAYVGGLVAQFVLPDEGRFDDVAASVPEAFAELDRSTAGADLALPRFETRYGASLGAALQALGLTAPFENGRLLGIADDPRLVLSDAVHETFVAMDEEGTEAAAATALIFDATSGPIGEPVPVILDRPFLFRIHDPRTDATLFLGRVMDPTT